MTLIGLETNPPALFLFSFGVSLKIPFQQMITFFFYKKSSPTPNCIFCQNAVENLDHLFKFCPKITHIWHNFQSFNIQAHLPFPLWLKYHCNHKKRLKFNIPWASFFPRLLRNIWIAQNDLLFNNKNINTRLILHHTLAETTEFFFLTSPSPSSFTHTFSSNHWTKPTPPFFKLNCNGSAKDNSLGVGGLIRDHNGTWISGFSSDLL